MRTEWREALTRADLWPGDEGRFVLLFNALSLAPGGSHSVIDSYLRCIVEQRPDWRVVLLRGPFDAGIDADYGPTVAGVHVPAERVAGVVRRTLFERRWLQRIAKRTGAAVYFGPNGVYHASVKIPQCLLVQDPTPYVLPPPNFRERFRAGLLRRAWAKGVRKAACMGYTSNYMRDLVVRSAGGATERRWLIAYNGIDARLRAAASAPAVPRVSRRRAILSVSTYAPHKNFETLIQALARLRRQPQFADFTLEIMGRNIRSSSYIAQISSDYLARLEAVARREGVIDAVFFRQDVSSDQLHQAYREAALFSLTSLCESFGIPAIEAMAHGTPVVVGDCCAVPEVVGNAGDLAPPLDPDAVAARWHVLLSDDERWNQRQVAGRARCLQFTWDQTVSRWISIMEQVAPVSTAAPFSGKAAAARA